MLSICDLIAVISLAITCFALGYSLGVHNVNNRQPRD